MMQTLCMLILKISLMAGCMVLFIFLFKRALGKYLNASFHYYIWFLLLLRLILPFNVESSLSIFNVVNLIPTYHNYTRLSPDESKRPLYRIISEQDSEKAQGETTKPNHAVTNVNNDFFETPPKAGISVIQILTAVWLSGVVFVFTIFTLSKAIFGIRLRRNESCTDTNMLNMLSNIKAEMEIKKEIPIILDRRIRTPVIFSFLFPKLVMPQEMIENFTPQEVEYILRHELTHYKRKDLFVFWAVSILQAIHWFNPLLWFAFYKMECDCESFCDTDVLRTIGSDRHLQYGLAIVKAVSALSANKMPLLNLGAGKSFSDTKRRIIMISKFKESKPKKRIVFTFSLIIILMGVLFLTDPLGNPVEASSDKQPIQAESMDVNSASTKVPLKTPAVSEDKTNPIYYDKANNRIVVKKTDKIKSAGDIKQLDEYWDKKYTFFVEGMAGVQTEQINTELVKSVLTDSKDGISTVTVTGNKVVAFAPSEDEKNIYFTAKKPAEVFKYVVVIDPAHGGADSGASSNGISEKDLTLALARQIAYMVDNTENSNMKVYLTRQRDDRLELEERTNFANEIGGIFINLHYNIAAPESEKENGTETYYFETNTEAKRLAEILQEKLVKELQTKDGTSRTGEFFTIKNVDLPAVIIEVAYLSNAEDLKKVTSEGFTEKAGLSILNGIREYLGIAGEISQVTATAFEWPVPTMHTISSLFGYRMKPDIQEKEFHTGIDIPAPLGSDIIAAADGTVTRVDENEVQGKMLVIDHGKGLHTVYAHNSEILIKEGEPVAKGQIIAKSGDTGDATGSHLHFEVQQNENPSDPILYLKP